MFQPQSMKTPETLERLREAAPELIVVVAHGKILPPAVLELPPHGCINVHASLLPRYRGAAPIQWAVLNGGNRSRRHHDADECRAGYRRHAAFASCPVPEDMTAGQLHDRLSVLGAQVLSGYAGCIKGEYLDSEKSRTMTNRAMRRCWINPFRRSTGAGRQLHNQVRGLNPWPSACCRCQGRLLKVHVSRVGESTTAEPGIGNQLDPFTVSCGGNTSLELLEVQGKVPGGCRGGFSAGASAAGTRLEDAAGQTENRP